MNIEPMTTTPDQISSEKNLPIKNQQGQTSKQIIMAKKGPMQPTRLEYSWWSTHPAEMKLGAFVLLIIITVVVGVMVVCLTQPLPEGKICGFVLKSSVRNTSSNDSRPHSVAIGDFNNDGLLDIVVPNSGMNNIGVFLRHANGTFTDQMIYSTGSDSTPYAVAVSDFNHDEQLDIAVANYDSHTIGIFVGIGNGTFKPQTTFSTGPSRPRSIAVGDFDNDTRHDIAVVNYGTYTVGVFLQDINGSFANQTKLSTGYDSDPYSLIVGDLNNDDVLDIVVANYGTNNVGVFVGHGDGSFAIQIIFSTGIHSQPCSIAIGNLNNDTYLDIVVANSGRSNVGVLLGYGNSTFAIPTMYSTGNNSLPRSVAIADLDNDNKLDIAVANYDTDSVIVLLGAENGNFLDQNLTFFSNSNLNPYSIDIGDFNNDNRSDIVVVNNDFNHVDVILNYRNFSFHPQTTYLTDVDSKPESIVIADLNNDNHQDIIVANEGNDNIMIFNGYGNGTFEHLRSYLFGLSSPCSVAVSDLNNDGQPDIVFANYGTDNIGVALGYGNGSFSPLTTFSTGNNSNPIAIATSDLNSDNHSDVVVANSGADNLGVFLGYGDGTFSSQVIYSTGFSSGPHSIAIGDFNNDSQLDLVVTNFWTSNVGMFLGHGDGTFSNQVTYSTANGSMPSSVVVGDFNSDSQSDVIVTNYGTGTLSLFLGYGNGLLSSEIILSIYINSGPWSTTTGDFNNDGQLDVAVANRRSNNLGVFLGYGNGSFLNQTTYSTGSRSSPYSIAVGDLNNDGHSDIAVADRDTNKIGIFMGYGNGNFTTQKTRSTAIPSYPQSVAVGDFNNDDQLDIVVANYWLDNVGIFLGDGYGNFSGQFIYHTGASSGACSVAVGDFNNDNQLDIVVANYLIYNIGVFLGYRDGSFSSQTTFPTGDNSHPIAVAVGDFNNDDRLDIVVANSWTSNVGIFLGYGNGIFASQVTFSTGSRSSPLSIAVGDFNNDSRLDIVVADHFNYNIGVLLGYGNGTFSSQITHSTEIGSGPHNVVVGDLNNDSRLDLVVVLRGASAITVFLGNDNGTFSRQLTYSAGSHSQPFACALGDMNDDHRLDVIVADIYNDDIFVLLGDDHGSFSNRTTYSTGIGSQPVSVAFADFNNDGILDVVVVNSNTNATGVFLGFSYINGTRESICSTGSASHPRAIALADFNKDTQLDMVITNYELDNVQVLLQGINSTFSLQMVFSTGALSLPISIAVGDLNSDNQLDITVANSGGRSIGVLYGHGNGSFTNQTTFSTDGELNFIPQSVAVGDFNNDQKLDIVVADSGTNSVRTLLRYDPGAFGNKTMYSTGIGSQPMWVAVGDLNNDDWLDFVVANGQSDNVGVFLGLGNGTFSSQTTYSTGYGSFPRCIAVADLNKDSQLDIIVCNQLTDTIGIFLGFGDGTFSEQITYSTGESSRSIAIAIGDLNKDDRLDIVVANVGKGNLGVFLANDNGTFFSMTNYSTGSNSEPISVSVGDFNDDNRLDIVVANVNSSNIGVFIGYGDGTFSAMIPYSTGSRSAPISVAVGDFNKDGQLDIVVADAQTDNIWVLFGDGNGTFPNQSIYSIGGGSEPNSLVIGDFNNDNQLDIATANFGSNSFSVLLGCGNGIFFSPSNYFIADDSQPLSIGVGDFNNDHRLDIVVTSTLTDQFGVFLGYASESFLFAPSTSTGPLSLPTSIAVGDFDHDTRLDVVVANSGADNVTILFGSGYGTFINPTTYPTGYDSNPCWVAVGDFNNDCRLDIVVANSGTNNVGLFLSNGNGTFSTQIIYSTGVASQPYSVAVLDLDNDTRLDVAVANYGSDSVLVLFGDGNGSFPKQLIFDTGFDSHPFALAIGDVNNDNLSDIIGTNDGYGNIDIISKEC